MEQHSDSLRLARLHEFYERGLDRLQDGWHGKGEDGVDFARQDHLYQRDLNILGSGSLFELLCTTRSAIGAERLASFLLDPADIAMARGRQAAVQELRDNHRMREEIALLGRYSFSGKRDL